MKWMMVILCLAVAAVDCMIWYYHIRRSGSRFLRVLFLGVAIIPDILIGVSMLIDLLAKDNPPLIVRANMWVFTLYIITVLARAGIYLPMMLLRRRAALIAAPIATAILLSIPIYGLTVGRKKIETKRVEICSDRLPESFNGFRIVQFSDLHAGTMLSPEPEIRAVVDTINSLKPDMVIFSGDLITIRYDEFDSRVEKILSEIDAPYGVWSFIGNHDAGLYVKDSTSLPVAVNRRKLLERERAMGWNIVDDTTVYIRRGDDSISLSGISFPDHLLDNRHDAKLPDADISAIYDGVSDEIFNITVSHLPQLWDNILECGFGDLSLSGHYHGMQIGINAGGFRLSPARIFYREWSGLYERRKHYLYINDGIGYVGFYIRIGTPPEVTAFSLSNRCDK